jgi:hypothetical protein
MEDLRDYVDEGPIGKRRLPVLQAPQVEDEDEEEMESETTTVATLEVDDAV